MFILDTLYEDFPTTYETQVNEFIIPIMIGAGILIILFIITLIALMKIFKKANRSGIAAYIPFYNLWVLLEIINKPKIYILLLLIPIINLIFYFQVIVALGKAFRKPSAFILGMLVFPLIFIPVLGFSSSEYIGINSEAMLGKSVAKDLPVIEDNNEDPVNKPAQPLQERKKVEMSLGGGVYQKDYQKTLVNIEGKKKIQKPNLADFRVDTSQQQAPSATPTQNNNGIDLLADVQFIETTPQAQTTNEVPQAPIADINSISETNDNQNSTPTTFGIPEIDIVTTQQEENPLKSEPESSYQQPNILPINEPTNPINNTISNNQPTPVANATEENNSNINIPSFTDSSVSPQESTTIDKTEPTIFSVEQFGIPTIQQEPSAQNSFENTISTVNSVNPVNTTYTNTPADNLYPQQPTEINQIEENKAPTTTPFSTSSISEAQPMINTAPPEQNPGTQGEYITCPHCGAKIKNGAPKCFMCGKPL